MAVKPQDILVALSDGHGDQTAGKRTPVVSELGRSIRENEFNRVVIGHIDRMLRAIGFRTLLVAPTDADTPLITRTNLANAKGADIYVSVHYDALGNTWNNNVEGHSIFVYTGNKNTKSGKLAECVAEFLKQGTSQKWRGIKEANLHEVRETKMPAILSENGFMDNPREARLMLNPAFQLEVATEHVKGICKYFGVPYKDTSIKAPVSKPVVNESKTTTAPKVTVSGDTYKVVKGDTLWGISQKTGVSVANLKSFNSLKDDIINPGDVLKLKKPVAKASTAPAGIKSVGTIKLTGVNNFTYIYEKNSDTSKVLGKAVKNSTYSISGSVSGWWEVIYNGKRAYIKSKYASRI
jgi:N-acetylmuramoyl-L-alanine amidase